MMPRAASKQAPEILPCSRSSGLGASPNLPSGSDPITLKYLKKKRKTIEKKKKKTCRRSFVKTRSLKPNLRIITAMFEFLEKSKMISSAIFLAFPYGLIGT